MREREGQRGTEGDRGGQRETERDRERQPVRDRERQRETERDRERQGFLKKVSLNGSCSWFLGTLALNK